MSLLHAEHALDTGPVRLPRVNLLPPELTAGSHLRKVQAAAVTAVVASVAAVALIVGAAHHDVSAAQDEVAAATADRTRVQHQVDGLRDVTQVYDQLSQARAALRAAMGGEVRYSGLLDDLSRAVPDSVWLTKGSWTEITGTAGATTGAVPAPAGVVGALQMSGVALSHDDVAHWMDVLAGRKGLGRPVLQSQTESRIGEHVVVDWAITLPVTDAALSGRYAGNGS